MRRASRALAAGLCVFAAACGSHNTPTGPAVGLNPSVSPPAGAVAQFSVSPVDLPPAGALTALGSLNPPGHVLPTDHVYFYPGSLYPPAQIFVGSTRNVYAPALGVVQDMLQPSGTDSKIWFLVTSSFTYYLDHVSPRAGLAVGTVVHAGDLVGTTNTTLDLGAYDYGTTLGGFVSPARYPDQTLHCVSPWKYFVEPLRSNLYSRVYRAPTAPDKDGKIDFDIAGRLAGAWFDPSVPMTPDASGPIGWPKTVAFAYDYYDPSLVRISIGGTIAPAGVWAIDPNAPRPETVSVATGKVSYQLLYTDTQPFSPPYGLMIVQMLSDTQIQIEVFVGSTATTADFDGGAFTFVR